MTARETPGRCASMRIIANWKYGNDLAISSCHWRVGAETARVDHRTAHAQGGGQASQGQRLLARQGAHARRRPALHPDWWSVDPLHRSCSAAMDEVAAASVDERAVGMLSSTQRKMYLEAGSDSPDLRLEAGIVIHRNTSVYININQVVLRLGMNIEVHKSVILLTISQITLDYISRHPHPLSSHER